MVEEGFTSETLWMHKSEKSSINWEKGHINYVPPGVCWPVLTFMHDEFTVEVSTFSDVVFPFRANFDLKTNSSKDHNSRTVTGMKLRPVPA